MPVFAAKSYWGNLGAGGGIVELALSLHAQAESLPRTLNYDEPDPACPVAVNRAPYRPAKPHFLKISLNEMGQCAVAVCRRWEEGQS